MRPVPGLPTVLLRTAAVVLLALLAACTRTRGIVVDEVPLVRGPVVALQHSATATGLTVGPGRGAPCGVDATADAATRYLRRTASGVFAPVAVGSAGAARLAVGDTVAVYVDGPVAESCPLQARASSIVLAPLP